MLLEDGGEDGANHVEDVKTWVLGSFKAQNVPHTMLLHVLIILLLR